MANPQQGEEPPGASATPISAATVVSPGTLPLRGGWRASFLSLSRKVIPLSVGEGISRLTAFILVAYVARVLGVKAVGIIALGQTVFQYALMGADMGSKFIGARLIAKDPATYALVVPAVQQKRIVMALFCFGAATVYALVGPVPPDSRSILVLFAFSVLPYALNLDWLVWGLEHYGLMAAWRSLIGVVGLVGGIVAAVFVARHALLGIAAANALAHAAGALMLWLYFRSLRSQSEPSPDRDDAAASVHVETRWAAVLVLGSAAIFNQLFQHVDILLLGAMGTVEDLGRYGAAYKILNVVFGAYYLLTTAAFPVLARLERTRKTRRILVMAVFGVAMLGSVVSLFFYLLSEQVMTFAFGPEFAVAAPLLKVLSLALPLDFAVALIGTILVSGRRDKVVAIALSVAAFSNIVLNLLWIPAHGAIGAAWATVVSYAELVVLLGVLQSVGIDRD